MPKPRQRKRPRAERKCAECQQRKFDNDILRTALTNANGEAKESRVIRTALRERAEKAEADCFNLTHSLVSMTLDRDVALREQEKLRAQLAEQTQRTNEWVQRWDQESNNYLCATAESATLRTNLSAANSRIAELTGIMGCGHPKACWQNWNVPGYGHCLICQANDEKEAAEARVARLIAEKDEADKAHASLAAYVAKLEADCTAIRTERDKAIRRPWHRFWRLPSITKMLIEYRNRKRIGA